MCTPRTRAAWCPYTTPAATATSRYCTVLYCTVLYCTVLYGHFEVTELLITHGANVNAMDLWQFTPLHEAASKSRTEVKTATVIV